MENLKAEVENDLNMNNTAAAGARIHQHLDAQSNIPINIAITGESGSGKSTFVNAFRGLGDEDEGAAPTGINDSSEGITPYPHPKYPDVTLWDLPGIGSEHFPAAEYLKLVGFEKFDFFIIITAERVKENDVKLAQEIQRMKKKFYIVRSKIDNNIHAEKRKKNFSERGTLDKLREDCVQGLKGVQDPKVFLVTSIELNLHDFSHLRETFESELPELRRVILLSAMSKINLEIIKKKKEAFQSKVKYYAALSAGVAAVPVPGLSAAVDLGLFVKVFRDYIAGFGLDKPSLKRLAASTGVSYTDLCAVIRSPLLTVVNISCLLLKPAFSFQVTAALMGKERMGAEEGSTWIPVFRVGAVTSLSFTLTYKALNDFLNALAEDAQGVFERALGFK